MKVMIINGPNINMLGIREPDIYGLMKYEDLCNNLFSYCKEKNIELSINQSNHEGELVNFIQYCYFDNFDGIIINAGAYTHTSIAILDALKSVNLPTVEIHISDPSKRESFRHQSYISLYTNECIKGKGIDGYFLAIDRLISIIKK